MATAAEVEANRVRLAAEVAALIAMLPGFPVAAVQRWLHALALSILRPAESATRRLIEILASELTVAAGPRRPPPEGGIPKGAGARRRAPVFGLFDPRKHPKPPQRRKSAPGIGPCLTDILGGEHVAWSPSPAPSPEDALDAGALCRRIEALRAALDDMPGQARRLARVYARGKAKWLRVMRPGRPPGHRSRGLREVDRILADCHWFALDHLRRKVPP